MSPRPLEGSLSAECFLRAIVAYQTTRVLIWGKTYPELSSKYVETVCTGGVRLDGTPIRLYPVPLRYLETGQQYKLYDIIDVPVRKSTSDPRPESHKVVSDKITRVAHMGTDKGSWRSRRDFVFRDPSWHFDSVEALKRAERESGHSLGLVVPGRIIGVRLTKRSEKERLEYDKKMQEIQLQGDVFRTEYKELEFLDHDIRLRWHCRGPCSECSKRPHEMKALDWGLLELARREGWDKASARLEDLSDLSTHDFRIFMGNFRLHPNVFGIIGLWYPKLKVQLEVL